MVSYGILRIFIMQLQRSFIKKEIYTKGLIGTSRNVFFVWQGMMYVTCGMPLHVYKCIFHLYRSHWYSFGHIEDNRDLPTYQKPVINIWTLLGYIATMKISLISIRTH